MAADEYAQFIKRFFYDTMGRFSYQTKSGLPVRFDILNPYCLLDIKKKLEEMGKQETKVYQAVVAEIEIRKERGEIKIPA
jgi:hypothetical protein